MKKDYSRLYVEGTEKKRKPQVHNTGNRKRQREMDKHLWMTGENEREGRQKAETLWKNSTKLSNWEAHTWDIQQMY